MELRYVYDKVEDAIGENKPVEKSPHSYLTYSLRHLMRARKNNMTYLSVLAVCQAAILGNSRIDTTKAIEGINETLETLKGSIYPYSEARAEHTEQDRYAAYFADLERLDKEKGK